MKKFFIGYVDNPKSNVYNRCSLEKFKEITGAEETARLVSVVRTEGMSKEARRLNKSRLAAFFFMGYSLNKSRKKADMLPTGLVMIDIDTDDANPRSLYNLYLKAMERAGFDTKAHLKLAHATPSGHGLRLVEELRPGSTIEADQLWVGEQMGIKIDSACKDLSRLSYAVTSADIFFIDETMFATDEDWEKAVNQPVAKQPVVAEKSSEKKLPVVADKPSAKIYPADYDGIPYKLLVECLADQLGTPATHGSRNQFIFSMACHLRSVCDSDPEWIAQVLPTYGEATDRWRSTINSAVHRNMNVNMPETMKRAISVARKRLAEEQAINEAENTSSPAIKPTTYLDAPEAPMMPAKLPPLVELLTSKVADVYKPAVAHAIFPALGAHLGGVKFRYIDNVDHEATFMCVLTAKQGAGKSCVNKPIELILRDIVERDELSRMREQSWKDDINSKGANKEKPKRPDDICIQVLVPDMTNAAFVQRLKEAKGKFLYTSMDEVELLDQMKVGSKGKQVSQIIRLSFDTREYGQERVGAQSVTAKVAVRWNWNASTTIARSRKYFRNGVSDGTVSRLNFCIIQLPRHSSMPITGDYDQAFIDALKPHIDNLNKVSGKVDCLQAMELAKKLGEENANLSILTDDDAFEQFSYRANVIAYLKACVLYVANGCQWDDTFDEFIRWSEQYDLWVKMHLFGEKLIDDQKQETFVTITGPRNMLDLLPNKFTLNEASNVRIANGKPADSTEMIKSWKKRGYIERDPKDGSFVKTALYLKRSRNFYIEDKAA